jgi:hypothetical protein
VLYFQDYMASRSTWTWPPTPTKPGCRETLGPKFSSFRRGIYSKWSILKTYLLIDRYREGEDTQAHSQLENPRSHSEAEEAQTHSGVEDTWNGNELEDNQSHNDEEDAESQPGGGYPGCFESRKL